MNVKPHHPLQELLARLLFSIETVPVRVQRSMVNRACREATKWHEEQIGKLERKRTMMEPTGSCFVFVVQTDCYAGNFKEKMSAFMTGQYGDGEYGEEQAKQFRNDNPDNDSFEKNVVQMNDGRGSSVTQIFWGETHTDFGIFFDTQPHPDQIKLMMDRAKTFAKLNPYPEEAREGIIITGFQLREFVVKTTDQELAVWDVDTETVGV